MVVLKTTAKVDRSRTLAVLVPQCGVEAGKYEVTVVLENPQSAAREPLTFSNHRLGADGGETWSRSEIYGDEGR